MTYDETIAWLEDQAVSATDMVPLPTLTDRQLFSLRQSLSAVLEPVQALMDATEAILGI